MSQADSTNKQTGLAEKETAEMLQLEHRSVRIGEVGAAKDEEVPR